MGHLSRLHRRLVKQGIRQMGENPAGELVMREASPATEFSKNERREMYYYNRLPDRSKNNLEPSLHDLEAAFRVDGLHDCKQCGKAGGH